MKMTAIVHAAIRPSRVWKRSLSGCIALLLTLVLAVPAWATVFTNSATITINDATSIGIGNPYPSNIAVSGMMGNVTNLTVTLSNITHTFPDDWDILLVGPTGANMIILSDVGGSDDVTNRTITLDDAAAATIPDSTTLNSGTFKPTNIGTGDTFPAPAPAPSANTTLATTFNGTNPNGMWSLYLVDDLGADMGVMSNGWSLNITTDMTSATTFTSNTAIFGGDGARGRATPYASTINVSGLTGQITNLTVTLTNINHLNPDDIDIMLISPSGKRIILLSDAGGTPDVVNQTLTFDDAAATTVPDSGPMVTGTFKPTNFGTGDTLPDLNPPYPNSATAGSATLASVFNGTNPNGTWRLYVVDDATTSAGDINGGWSIDITAGGMGGARRFTSGDFDGDGETDVAVFRPSDHNWYFRSSSTYANSVYPSFGDSTDIIVPEDYDGDGKTDVAVFRPSQGRWYIVQSMTSTVQQVAWGVMGDTPVPADYDGDGKVDVAVWRSGVWYILQSSNGMSRVVSWGLSSDIPVRGYFKGTNGADFTVFRPSDTGWYTLNNAGTMSSVVTFGLMGDVLVPADYDGDGKTDQAVFRDGSWFILQSTNGMSLGRTWGAAGDIPVPGDYDADAKADVAVWRPSTGTWYLLNSGTPPGATALRIDNWGLDFFGDRPTPRSYFPQ